MGLIFLLVFLIVYVINKLFLPLVLSFFDTEQSLINVEVPELSDINIRLGNTVFIESVQNRCFIGINGMVTNRETNNFLSLCEQGASLLNNNFILMPPLQSKDS